MPHRRTLVRLGYRESRTRLSAAQRTAVEQAMSEGFSLCRPQACWARLAIAQHSDGGVLLEDGTAVSSASLAYLLRRSTAVAVMAATVGPDIVQAAADAAARGDGATAVIYDAVGGQTTEAAMGWLNDLIRQLLLPRGEGLTTHRFSPGYGDLHLQTQQSIHGWLQLERLGVALTPSWMLVPEKTVTALVGIERTATIKEQNDA